MIVRKGLKIPKNVIRYIIYDVTVLTFIVLVLSRLHHLKKI